MSEGAFQLVSAGPTAQPCHVILDTEDLRLRIGGSRDECLATDSLQVDLSDIAHVVRCDERTLALLSRSLTRRALVLRCEVREQADMWNDLIETSIALITEKRSETWEMAASGAWPHRSGALAPAPAVPSAAALFVQPASVPPPPGPPPPQPAPGGGITSLFGAAASLFVGGGASAPAPALATAAPAPAPVAPAVVTSSTAAAAAAAASATAAKFEQEVPMRLLKSGVKSENPKPWDWEKDNMFVIIEAGGLMRYAQSTRADALAASAKTARLAECSCSRSVSDIITIVGPGVSLTLKPGSKDVAESFTTTLKRYCKGEDAAAAAKKAAEAKAAEEARLKREEEERRRKEEEARKAAEAKAAEEARLKREEEERRRREEEERRRREDEERRQQEEAARKAAEAKAAEEAARAQAAAAATRVTSPTNGGRAMESELKVLQNPSRPWEFQKRYFLVAGDALRIGVDKADASGPDALSLPLSEISSVMRKDLFTLSMTSKSVGGELVVKAETKAIADGWVKALSPPPAGGWV